MKLPIFHALFLGLWLGGAAQGWAHPEGPRSETAHSESSAAVDILPEAPSTQAAADLMLASDWLARAYEVPARVPQEMLLHGYTYADTLIALSMMHKGASLNELLELRRQMRWQEVAERVELDPNTLPAAVRSLLQLGYKPYRPQVLHFLPDPYAGISRDLTINAFPPTIPTGTQIERYRLNDEEVANIRRALDDPFGVPDELLQEYAGKGALRVGDWVMAGVIAHHKPLSLESVLSARSGQQLSWSEIALAYGFRPDVLTRGPLAAIYPVVSGSAPGTILVARKRRDFPLQMPLRYELSRLTVDEKVALRPLMLRAYRASGSEDTALQQSGLSMTEQGIALELSRISQLDVGQILGYHRSGVSWAAIPPKLQLDLTGEDALRAALEFYGR
jgi:hypothetical protein